MALAFVVATPDRAAQNIRDAMLAQAPWQDAGEFEGHPVRQSGDVTLVDIATEHLHANGLDARLRAAGFVFDGIAFASRHRAASGAPALTVHPLGNLSGSADFGGIARRLTPTMPAFMARVLRALAAECKGLGHKATFEATHHGPLLETPACFVEIGTVEEHWRDPDLGARVARAMLAAAHGDALAQAREPVLLALGGSHYAPRATDLARKHRVAFGHIVPAYAIEAGIDASTFLEAIRGTHGIQGYFLDERNVDATKLAPLLEMLGALDLGRFMAEDLTGL